MLSCIRTSFKPSKLLWHWQLLDLNSFDCKVLHYVLKYLLHEIRAVVLSEDKAQDKYKRIVVNCYFIFAVRLSYSMYQWITHFGCCSCEFTLTSDHFIVHFFCTKICFFLLWTLKMMHVFFRGLSVHFLIALHYFGSYNFGLVLVSIWAGNHQPDLATLTRTF